MKKKNPLCGFECVFSKKSDVWNYFNPSNLMFENCYYKVDDAAVYSHCKRIDILEEFQPSYFQELIQKSFVAERLVLHLYPENVDFTEIDTYEDYLESKCEMIILLYDFYYMEIYCKNQEWLNKLICAAHNIPGAVVENKYEDTDGRTAMYV